VKSTSDFSSRAHHTSNGEPGSTPPAHMQARQVGQSGECGWFDEGGFLLRPQVTGHAVGATMASPHRAGPRRSRRPAGGCSSPAIAGAAAVGPPPPRLSRAGGASSSRLRSRTAVRLQDLRPLSINAWCPAAAELGRRSFRVAARQSVAQGLFEEEGVAALMPRSTRRHASFGRGG
jgi:hypothetical protein